MKKTLAIVLALLMIVALFVGCTKTETNNGSNGAKTEEKTEEKTETKTEEKVEDTGKTGEGPSTKFDPMIDIHTVTTVNSAVTDDNTVEDNNWTKLYKDKYGINIIYDAVYDASQYNEKVNLLIVSGEIPDFLYLDSTMYQQVYEADLLQPLNDAYYDYAEDYTVEMMQESGMMAFTASERDGKLYAIPWTTLVKENTNVILIRQDWLDKMGIDGPKTYADFENYLKTVSEQKPGGVSWALGDNKSLGVFYNIARMFGAYNNIWLEKDDGTLEFSIIQPEMKDALAAYQQWVKAGYVDPEFATKDGTKNTEDIASGICGIQFGPFSNPLGAFQTAYNNDSTVEMGYYPIPSAAGGMTKNPIDTGIYMYYVASKDCEHPEALTLMINSFMDKFYLSTSDEDAVNYVNAPTGEGIWSLAYGKAYRGFKNYQQYKDINKYLNKEMTYEELTSDSKGVATRIDQFLGGDGSMWGWNEIYGIGNIWTAVEPLIEDDWFIQTAYAGPPTESMGTKQGILDTTILETFTKIIQGQNVDTFDDFVTQWKALGGQAITDEVNEWYKNNK